MAGLRGHNGGGGGGRLVELPKPKVTLGGGQGSPVRVPTIFFFFDFFLQFWIALPHIAMTKWCRFFRSATRSPPKSGLKVRLRGLVF